MLTRYREGRKETPVKGVSVFGRGVVRVARCAAHPDRNKRGQDGAPMLLNYFFAVLAGGFGFSPGSDVKLHEELETATGGAFSS